MYVRIFFSKENPNITRERLVIFHWSCEEVSIDHITIFFVQPNERKKAKREDWVYQKGFRKHEHYTMYHDYKKILNILNLLSALGVT